jgi:hypothetical protein
VTERTTETHWGEWVSESASGEWCGPWEMGDPGAATKAP